MRLAPLSALLPFVIALLLVLPFPAFAGEGVDADEASPAAQAYRDAWWAETGAGELDKALEGYARALELEGSDAVRARALYRLGVLLERTGRTDEAIRAFERLAKTFPGEKALLQKARALLEAWTAEDLETSFDDWYERYRFSPAFQAKVVDLLLRLGTKTYDAKNDPPAEEKELLTIGEAALPALRRHVGTDNATLRSWVVALLLQLGELPPVDALLEGGIWIKRPRAWTTLMTLPEDEAARLRERLLEQGGGELGDIVSRTMEGPESALRILRREYRALDRRLWGALWDAVQGRASMEALVAFVADDEVPVDTRTNVLRDLLRQGEAPEDLVLDVLRDGEPRLVVAVLSEIHQGRLHVPGAWRAIAEQVLEGALLQGQGNPAYQAIPALVRSVGVAGAEADLTPAVAAMRRLGASGANVGGPGTMTDAETWWAGFDRLLPDLVEGATQDSDASRWIAAWRMRVLRDQAFDAQAWRRFLVWARGDALPEVRRRAARTAGYTATDAVLDEALETLRQLGPREGNELIQGLRPQGNRQFRWTPTRLRVLLEEAARLDESGRTPKVQDILRVLFASPAGVIPVVDLVLETPGQIWEKAFTWTSPSGDVYQDPGVRARVREGLQAEWEGWRAAERAAALQTLGVLARPGSNDTPDAFVAWVRAQLVAPDDEREVKQRLLDLLPAPTLDDVRAAYDLEDPEQAEVASRLQRLPSTVATYEALAAARRLPDGKMRDRFWDRWLTQKKFEVVAIRRAVARDMLEDPQAHTRARGVEFLRDEEELDNLPFLLKGLRDEDANVRRLAAEGMAKVYDRAALVALAAALDDPAPAVREAVLATLEQIRKTEELKAYWKEYAENAGK